MKKRIFLLLKIALIVLAPGIAFICAVPIKSNTIAQLALSPVEKRLHNKVEFNSSRIWLPGYVFLEDMSVIDEKGRLYHCNTAHIKYNPLDLFLMKGAFSFNLKEIKFYQNIAILDSVTDMLVISKIPDVEFRQIDGVIKLRKNRVYFENINAYSGSIRIKGNGWIDQSGLLDCDANFSFYKDITNNIPDIVKKTLLTREGEGWMGISFKARGNYKKPSLQITGNRLELNIMEGLFGDE